MNLTVRIIKLLMVFLSLIFSGCATFSSNTVIENNKKSHFLYIVGIPIWSNKIEYIDENFDFYAALMDEIQSKEKLVEEITRQLNSKIEELKKEIEVNRENKTKISSLKKDISILHENLRTARVSVIKSKEEKKAVAKEKEERKRSIFNSFNVPSIFFGNDNTVKNNKLE